MDSWVVGNREIRKGCWIGGEGENMGNQRVKEIQAYLEGEGDSPTSWYWTSSSSTNPSTFGRCWGCTREREQVYSAGCLVWLTVMLPLPLDILR